MREKVIPYFENLNAPEKIIDSIEMIENGGYTMIVLFYSVI